jgi:hypothetical protein
MQCFTEAFKTLLFTSEKSIALWMRVHQMAASKLLDLWLGEKNKKLYHCSLHLAFKVLRQSIRRISKTDFSLFLTLSPMALGPI